ncbi:unnamed protein product [Brassicogethes aeneus]|uniref:Cyclin N-terminal domain-containing protein n=1 Tax=Brassicogethes aeneus TaxID=1431903 RepID=A0A9P0BC11_BRAAE|nr:unnamed protein product [Brassicogethes aeneus]
MDHISKKGSKPLPDAGNMKYLAFKLEEALAAEQLVCKQNLLLIQEDRKPGEVTIASRDGAVHIFRFLRIWFDLPSTVFFNAALYLDQFLAKIKVQERYLKCVTISCFYVAATNAGYDVDKLQLVNVSQSKCSVNDMLRMAEKVEQKLKIGNADIPSTCADFLDIYVDILEMVTTVCDAPFVFATRETLLTRLEVLMTDHRCAFYRPSMLALALVQIEIERQMGEMSEKSLYYLQDMVNVFVVIAEIQHTCQIRTGEMVNCYNSACSTLSQYDNQEKAKHSQNLMWRFSSSTYALCNKYRYNRNAHYLLDTIEEQFQ